MKQPQGRQREETACHVTPGDLPREVLRIRNPNSRAENTWSATWRNAWIHSGTLIATARGCLFIHGAAYQTAKRRKSTKLIAVATRLAPVKLIAIPYPATPNCRIIDERSTTPQCSQIRPSGVNLHASALFTEKDLPSVGCP